MEYRIKEGHYGKSIITDITLAQTDKGARILRLSTSKDSNRKGQIYTMAHVHIEETHDGYKAQIHALFKDYSKTIARDICNRVTEKALITLHQEALKRLSEVTQEAKEHYNKDIDAA